MFEAICIFILMAIVFYCCTHCCRRCRKDGQVGRRCDESERSITDAGRSQRNVYVISVNEIRPPVIPPDDPPKYEFEDLPPTYEELYRETPNQNDTTMAPAF